MRAASECLQLFRPQLSALIARDCGPFPPEGIFDFVLDKVALDFVLDFALGIVLDKV